MIARALVASLAYDHGVFVQALRCEHRVNSLQLSLSMQSLYHLRSQDLVCVFFFRLYTIVLLHVEAELCLTGSVWDLPNRQCVGFTQQSNHFVMTADCP